MPDQVKDPVTSHAGILEHFYRVWMFHSAASQQSDFGTSFRLLLAAIYSCQAIVELMLESATRAELSIGRKELSPKLAAKLPYFDLVERIRIHDFHRYGISPPIPGFRFGLGPSTLKASKGEAALVVTRDGPHFHTTGNSTVIERRPLFGQDGRFYDARTSSYVSLDTVVKGFAGGVAAAVEEYESLRIAPTEPKVEEPSSDGSSTPST